jgi:hypothetical protein
MWIMGFHDRDGFYLEVIWHKPGVPDTETLRRVDWTTVHQRPRPTAWPLRGL